MMNLKPTQNINTIKIIIQVLNYSSVFKLMDENDDFMVK